MRRKLLLIVTTVIMSVFLNSCTTSRTIVSDSVDLSKYEYASLTDVTSYNGSASLMDIEVMIFNALEKTRLKMIGDNIIGELSYEQKEKLLLVRFSATASDNESVISVNFVDYMSGKPVASCRGAFGLGISRQHDMIVAIDRVTEQIITLWGKQ